MKVTQKRAAAWLFAIVAVSFSTQAVGQRSGQSIQIQYGVVVASSYVQERSNAPAGALVGGAIGLYTGKGKSSGSKFRRTAAGAAAGGVAASAAQGSRDARQYEVRTGSGVVVIISDQTEIQVDDCVIVENPGTSNANIRRVAATYCDPASSAAVAEMQDEMQEEAEECAAAKRDIVNASTDEEIDQMLRKISMLCDT